MTGTNEHIEIRTIQQIAALTPDQQKVFLKDLEAWLGITNMHREMAKLLPEGVEITMPDDVIYWVDDDRGGEVSGVNVQFRLNHDAKRGNTDD